MQPSTATTVHFGDELGIAALVRAARGIERPTGGSSFWIGQLAAKGGTPSDHNSVASSDDAVHDGAWVTDVRGKPD